jgi:DNA-binding transcriptional MerR regulator
MAHYSIEALASRAGSTVRNVRAYQDRGLLPPPGRQGRHAVYDSLHLARVRLIVRFLRRGYTLASIKDLLDAQQQGVGVGGVLDLVTEVTGPWSNESPTVITEDELTRMFGVDDPVARKTAVELGLLEREGDCYRVVSPRLLTVGAQLRASGVPLDEAIAHLKALRGAMEAVAAQFVALVARHIPILKSNRFPEAADLVRRLRPLAQAAVDAELARAMRIEATRNLEKVLARHASAGPTARPNRRSESGGRRSTQAAHARSPRRA